MYNWTKLNNGRDHPMYLNSKRPWLYSTVHGSKMLQKTSQHKTRMTAKDSNNVLLYCRSSKKSSKDRFLYYNGIYIVCIEIVLSS